MLTYTTAGESSGDFLTVIVDGVPAGLSLNEDDVSRDLERSRITFSDDPSVANAADEVFITGGVSANRTTGAPVSFLIRRVASPGVASVSGVSGASDAQADSGAVTVPRPGHAELEGVLKYGLDDCREVASRASARECAARVVAGCVARELLAELDVDVFSFVCGVGRAQMAFSACGFAV